MRLVVVRQFISSENTQKENFKKKSDGSGDRYTACVCRGFSSTEDRQKENLKRKGSDFSKPE